MEAAVLKGADRAVLEDTQARLRQNTARDIVSRVCAQPLQSATSMTPIA